MTQEKQHDVMEGADDGLFSDTLKGAVVKDVLCALIYSVRDANYKSKVVLSDIAKKHAHSYLSDMSQRRLHDISMEIQDEEQRKLAIQINNHLTKVTCSDRALTLGIMMAFNFLEKNRDQLCAFGKNIMRLATGDKSEFAKYIRGEPDDLEPESGSK